MIEGLIICPVNFITFTPSRRAFRDKSVRSEPVGPRLWDKCVYSSMGYYYCSRMRTRTKQITYQVVPVCVLLHTKKCMVFSIPILTYLVQPKQQRYQAGLLVTNHEKTKCSIIKSSPIVVYCHRYCWCICGTVFKSDHGLFME